jgi:hypothetical protein
MLQEESGRSFFVQRSNNALPGCLCCVQARWRPMLKLLPYVLRFQPERITDRHEGEEPVRVIAEKPLLSLPRALSKPSLRLKLFMKTAEGIFEHSVQQRRLRAHLHPADPRVEELFPKRADIGPTLVPGISIPRCGLP